MINKEVKPKDTMRIWYKEVKVKNTIRISNIIATVD